MTAAPSKITSTTTNGCITFSTGYSAEFGRYEANRPVCGSYSTLAETITTAVYKTPDGVSHTLVMRTLGSRIEITVDGVKI